MRYWMAVASREHVLRGVAGGFAQVCHGKAEPLQKWKIDDWVIYYSPTEIFGEKLPCRHFTALGRVVGSEPYQVAMSDDFIPWRRNVSFSKISEVPIMPLIEDLSFISDKKHWGFSFRRGCFAIPTADFKLVAKHMGM